MMTLEEIIREFKEKGDPDAAEGMARYGIETAKVYGVKLPELRKLGKRIGRDHGLALCLWDEGSRESRILAGMVADPAKATEELLEHWVADFRDWEVCDQTCMNYFDKTPFAVRKCFEWSGRKEEFVKRAGFALMARLAWTAKDLTNPQIELFFEPIRQQAVDGRNGVKKAVNWALRQIGKRNAELNHKAIAVAEEIGGLDSKAARWMAADALKELRSEAVQERLKRK
jgi:3-methyladenine DNA glycosylase AlkD